MACRVCASLRSVWDRFAAQRARRAERKRARAVDSHRPPKRIPAPGEQA